jgi:hypothetical protein
MSIALPDGLLRAATRFSEKASHNGCADSPRPSSRAMLRVAGESPFRILLLGSGPVVGFGVLTHEVALAGHLARRVSEATGCGIDMDVVTQIGLHARHLMSLMAEVIPDRYDLVIVSVGTQDVLDCTALDDWSPEVERVLDVFGAGERAVPVHVIAVPQVSKVMGLERTLARAADNRVAVFNSRLEQLCEARAELTFVPFPLRGTTESCRERTSESYRRWADVLMKGIVPGLGSLRHAGWPGDQEELRQAALNRLGILDAGPEEFFDRITEKARRMFHTVGAGLSLIDHDRQWFASTAGLGLPELPRTEAVCAHTITTNHGLIVEDASVDPRFAGSYFVTTAELRSYVGVPIRDPDGHMIGALCAYDDKPRTFLPTDLTLLRHLAHSVEEHLHTLV